MFNLLHTYMVRKRHCYVLVQFSQVCHPGNCMDRTRLHPLYSSISPERTGAINGRTYVRMYVRVCMYKPVYTYIIGVVIMLAMIHSRTRTRSFSYVSCLHALPSLLKNNLDIQYKKQRDFKLKIFQTRIHRPLCYATGVHICT